MEKCIAYVGHDVYKNSVPAECADEVANAVSSWGHARFLIIPFSLKRTI